MLVLNKDKENLLVEKYGFTAKKNDWGSYWYSYKRTALTIWSSNSQYKPCRVDINSVSMELQDKLYGLIKDDVLICVPNEDKQAKILKIEEKIKKMQEQIDKLKKEED